MSPNIIFNFVLFQATWFGSVVGAGVYQLHWLAISAAVLVFAHAMTTPSRWTDLTNAGIAVFVGYTLDNVWVTLGFLSYPESHLAPYWLAILWFGFGLSINHSLKFFRDLKWLGAVIVGAFGPVTYLSAEQFGAVTVNHPFQLLWVTITWIFLFRGLTFYSMWHLGQNHFGYDQPESTID